MAVIDPVFAYLEPAAARALEKASATSIKLPAENASAALYAAVDAAAPSVVYLSPLLAAEIQPLLSRGGETKIAYVGDAEPRSDPRLYASVFSSVDAAAAAARLIAARAGGQAPQNEGRIAVVASGPDAGAVSEAFVAAFRLAGGLGDPVIELAPQGFTQAAADRLKALDVSAAYISVQPKDIERWASLAFDRFAFVAAEYALPSLITSSSADAYLAWDVEASVAALSEALAEGASGSAPGAWKSTLNTLNNGNKR
jgi:hypothetical protein